MKDIRILLLILILGSRCALSVGIADAQNALGCTNVTVRGFYNMELNFMADEDGNKYLPDDEDAYYKSDTIAVDEVRLLDGTAAA